MASRILIMRHGEAETNADSDEARHLTETGSRVVISQCRHLSGFEPDKIISSPFVRARETADIVAGDIRHRGEMIIDDAYVPGADVAQAGSLLMADDSDTVLLVSHMPLVSRLVQYLAHQAFGFDPAQICCLSKSSDQGEFSLEWVA